MNFHYDYWAAWTGLIGESAHRFAASTVCLSNLLNIVSCQFLAWIHGKTTLISLVKLDAQSHFPSNASSIRAPFSQYHSDWGKSSSLSRGGGNPCPGHASIRAGFYGSWCFSYVWISFSFIYPVCSNQWSSDLLSAYPAKHDRWFGSCTAYQSSPISTQMHPSSLVSQFLHFSMESNWSFELRHLLTEYRYGIEVTVRTCCLWRKTRTAVLLVPFLSREATRIRLYCWLAFAGCRICSLLVKLCTLGSHGSIWISLSCICFYSFSCLEFSLTQVLLSVYRSSAKSEIHHFASCLLLPHPIRYKPRQLRYRQQHLSE